MIGVRGFKQLTMLIAAGHRAGEWWNKPAPSLPPRAATPVKLNTDALLPKDRITQIREALPKMKKSEAYEWDQGRWVKIYSKVDHGGSIAT